MAWWKKGILFFLSGWIVWSCSFNNRSVPDEGTAQKSIELNSDTLTSKQQFVQLIDTFFETTKDWGFSTPYLLDSIGKLIVANDDSLQFYDFGNSYETDACLFSAKDKSSLNCFIQSSFLSATKSAHSQSYYVWRRKTNNHLLMDFSLAPHPTLGWVFVVRKRAQE